MRCEFPQSAFIETFHTACSFCLRARLIVEYTMSLFRTALVCKPRTVRPALTLCASHREVGGTERSGSERAR